MSTLVPSLWTALWVVPLVLFLLAGFTGPCWLDFTSPKKHTRRGYGGTTVQSLLDREALA